LVVDVVVRKEGLEERSPLWSRSRGGLEGGEVEGECIIKKKRNYEDDMMG
jgi:hypothetical protein